MADDNYILVVVQLPLQRLHEACDTLPDRLKELSIRKANTLWLLLDRFPKFLLGKFIELPSAPKTVIWFNNSWFTMHGNVRTIAMHPRRNCFDAPFKGTNNHCVYGQRPENLDEGLALLHSMRIEANPRSLTGQKITGVGCTPCVANKNCRAQCAPPR